LLSYYLQNARNYFKYLLLFIVVKKQIIAK